MYIVFHCLGDTRITNLKRFDTIKEAKDWAKKQSSSLLEKIAKNPKMESVWIQIRTEADQVVYQNQRKLVQVQLFGGQNEG
tara:strand:+ start:64 stop:306 length:243 start_codon:yes stop_codon:yes gene_type:complete